MNKVLISIGIMMLLGVTVYIFSERSNRDNEKDNVHIHAGFNIIVDGEVLDLSDPLKMYFEPCGLDKGEQQTVKDKVHLHDLEGNVAHIHAKGVIWKNIFESLEITPQKEGNKMYMLNGHIVENLLEVEIKDLDSALFIFDKEKISVDMWLNHFISRDYIVQIGSNSIESCGN